MIIRGNRIQSGFILSFLQTGVAIGFPMIIEVLYRQESSTAATQNNISPFALI